MSEVTANEAAPTPAARRSSRPRLRLALVGLCVVAAIGFLLVKGLGSSLDYFKTVDQAAAQRSQLGASTFRLEGTVVAGSVERTATGASFDLKGTHETIHVVNQGSPPQLFKDDMPVIAVGHLDSVDGSFRSNQLMVKHSSSYVASHPNRVRAGDGSVN